MAILSRGILVSTTPSAGGGDGGSVGWSDVTNKPTTFPSSWATIADKPTTFPTAWADVTDKPVILTEEDLAPIALSGSVDDIIDLPFPVTAGTPGQVLTSNESGEIVWSDAPAGGITALEEDTAPVLGGSLTIPSGMGMISDELAISDAGEDRQLSLIVSMIAPELSPSTATVVYHNAASPSDLIIQTLSRDLILDAANGDVIVNGLTLPNSDGTEGQLLATDGAGNLAFIDAPAGDSASGETATITTTDNTPTEILRLPVMSGSTLAVNLLISSIGSDIGYAADVFVAAKNVAGTVSFVGQVGSSITYDAGAAARAVNYTIDGADLVVSVVGDESSDVVWHLQSGNYAPNLQAPVLNSYRVPFATATVSAGAVTLDCNTANAFEVTLTENVTAVTITNAVETQLVLVLRQDATGGRTVAGWPANVMWPGGTAPTVTATADAVDMIVLVYNGALDVWLANVSQDYQ